MQGDIFEIVVKTRLLHILYLKYRAILSIFMEIKDIIKLFNLLTLLIHKPLGISLRSIAFKVAYLTISP